MFTGKYFWGALVIIAMWMAVLVIGVVAEGGFIVDSPGGDVTIPVVWGVALMVVGAFALSHTLFGFSLAWLNRWWPAALVLVGVYLVYKSLTSKK